MMLHWPSFVFGLAVLPTLAALLIGVLRLTEILRAQSDRLQDSHGSGTGGGLEPLRFTPRLIGQLRRPLEVEEDQVRAS